MSHYPHSWHKAETRPEPCLLDVQYDWDGFYRTVIDRISDYSKSPYNPAIVRAFRFQKSKNGIVAMTWKPKAESGEFRGADGNVGSDGFVVLKGRPRGIPGLVEPDKEILAKKYYNQLTGKPMTEYLIASGAPGAPAWLAAAAKYGEIPYVRAKGRSQRCATW